MAEIGFYHLTRTGPDQALPPLLGRTLAAGQRAAGGLRQRGTGGGAGHRAVAVPRRRTGCRMAARATGDADLQPIWLATAGSADARPATAPASCS